MCRENARKLTMKEKDCVSFLPDNYTQKGEGKTGIILLCSVILGCLFTIN